MTSRTAIAIEAGDYQFAVNFPYISTAHVQVAFNRLIRTEGLDFYWRDSQNIEFFRPPGKGVLEINRHTPTEQAMVLFHNGSQLTQEELNTAVLQVLYGLQETKDYYDALINGALDSLVLQSGAEEAGPVIDKVIKDILSSEELKELSARIADINLNARSITATQVSLQSTNDNLSNLQGMVDALMAPDGGVATLIKSETNARVVGDQALVDTLDLIGAKSGDGTAFIADMNTLKVSPQESFAQRFSALQTKIDNANSSASASVSSEQTARVNADGALGQRIDAVQASLTSSTGPVTTAISAAVATEATARANADGALGTRIDTVTANYKAADTQVTKDVTALVNAEATARSNADGAMASRLDVIETTYSTTSAVDGKITTVKAQVAAEQTARSDADQALTTTFNQQLSQYKTDANAYAQGLVQSESTTRATADTAAATRMDGLQSTINGNKALFDSEVTTRATADSAISSRVDTLNTTVGGHTSSIQTLQQTTNGLAAQYMVKTDVNGYVAGFGLWNGGTSSKFYVLADQFAIISPGYAGVVPFAVDANGVYMNNAYIRNLTVDKITGGAINAQWNINSTNGRIVLDTGTYMKVIGVGFGAYGDLIEWFGPKMAISSCTKQNAITYCGMDGSAYFGGSLSAGKLYNAAQSTNTAGDAYVVVGPFASNGNAKTVVVTYTRSINEVNQVMNSAGFTNPGGGSCLVSLYRTLNGGGELLVAQQTVSGSWNITNESDGADSAIFSMSGSFTFVDNSGATSNMTYVARLSNMSIPSPGGVSPTGITTSARLGVVSTEN